MYNNLTELTIRFAVHYQDFNEDFLMANYDKLNDALNKKSYGVITSNEPIEEILLQENIEWFREENRSKTLTTFLEIKKIETGDSVNPGCYVADESSKKRRKYYEGDKYND